MRRILAILVVAMLSGPAVGQQPPAGTLDDIRLNLQAIDAQLQALRAQLVATGRQLPPAQGDPLGRLETLERQIRQLTGRVEQIQNDVRRMAEDAGRRYADVEFRLSEIEGGDAALPEPVPLGGADPAPPADTIVAVAVTERNAFDAAETLVAEDPALAEDAFLKFLADYPGSPLTQAARLGLAEAQAGMGRVRDAARNYLAAFNIDPAGPRAAEALLGVGVSLRVLGQMPEACLTYEEVDRRFPMAGEDLRARMAQERLAAGCS